MTQSILIIEDDADLARLMQVQLSNEGYEVTVAIGGDQGLKEAVSSDPSAVVLDLRMAPTDGFEVLRQLKGSPATAAIPVIVTSVVDEAEGRATAAGASAFVIKPHQPGRLAEVVRSILG